MYLAELHGKLSRDNENKEDILTSNVFSFFKYADRSIFLYKFIKSLQLDISENDAMNAEFEFWKKFDDGTEPDLILIIGKYYLLFEAKFHSGFGRESTNKKHQIEREITGGQQESWNLGRDFKIIAITAHYAEKTEICKDIPAKYRDDVLWTNWQSTALLIYQILEKEIRICKETRLFAQDLYDLLVRKKLRNFEGVKVLSALPRMAEGKSDHIFFDAETARFRVAFLGFIKALSVQKAVQPSSPSLFWNPHRSSNRLK